MLNAKIVKFDKNYDGAMICIKKMRIPLIYMCPTMQPPLVMTTVNCLQSIVYNQLSTVNCLQHAVVFIGIFPHHALVVFY